MRLRYAFLFCVAVLSAVGGLARASDRDDRSGGDGGSDAAARASIRGVLVIASNDPGQPDPRLALYEPTLRRILRFESYRAAGEGSASVSVPGAGGVSLGRGHRLDVETESVDGGGLRVRVRWSEGSKVFMNTGLVLRRGVPVVLGGPARSEGGVYAVIIIAD
jgi:hypothetical protein